MIKRMLTTLVLVLLALPTVARGAEELALQEVFSAVARKVNPCLVAVRITSDRADEDDPGDIKPPPLTGIPSRGPRQQPRRRRGPSLGDGPVTGLVLTQDGYIITTNFKVGALGKEDKLEVVFSDGRTLPAEKIATDEARGLVLVKVDARDLPVPRMVRRDDLDEGQWAIALGKGLTVKSPEIKVGIVSALYRAGGKAIQTDAATSPTNYGGALCDIEGRVMGVLVSINGRPTAAPRRPRPTPRPRKPAKPEEPKKPGDKPEQPDQPEDNPEGDKPDEKPDEAPKPKPTPKPTPRPRPNPGTGGLGMYDSGIAFAIPLEDIYRQLPTMKQGKSIVPGAVGVLFETDETIQDGALVKGVAPGSPAEQAGLKKGDKVVAVNDRPVSNFRDLVHYIGRFNAGDDVTATYTRGDDVRATVAMTLIDRTKLKPIKPEKKPEPKKDEPEKDQPKTDEPKPDNPDKDAPDEDEQPEVPDQDQG